MDCSTGTFSVPDDMPEVLMNLINEVLSAGVVHLRTLERVVGKCMSMEVAVPAARLYTRQMYALLNRCAHSYTRAARAVDVRFPRKRKRRHVLSVRVPQAVREELLMWLQLRTHLNGALWLHPSHTVIHVELSSLGWGGPRWHRGAIRFFRGWGFS